MKKIDLHIHTVSSITDSDFEFSLEKLNEYVEKLEIDCIAITNHNLFVQEQFTEINDNLNIYVLPGIEIDLEGSHLLLISDNNEISDFSQKCNQIQSLITSSEDSITVEKLQEIFINLDKYLLIPHYDKKPNISQATLNKLNGFVSAGEVTSIRKFKSCIKDKGGLTPVLFSDSRFSTVLESYSPRQTYIDLDEITLSGIKSCLFDKSKVFLSKDDGNDLFQASENGLMLSTGLNVILGERSSGKTWTLNTISTSFENVKYIKQFSLLQNDEEKFKDLLSRRQSSVSEAYLRELKTVLEDITKVEIRQNEKEIKEYINSLLKYASENQKADAFSKTKLFSENLFSEKKLDSIKKIIDAVKTLIINSEYREIIDRHISTKDLKALIIDLIENHNSTTEENLKKAWLNDLISDIQSQLQFRTTSTFPKDIDFYKILMDYEKVKRFSKTINNLKIEKEIDSKNIRGFKIIAKSKKYTGAQQLKNKSKRKISFSEPFDNYDNPYDFLQCLKKIDLEETDFYKYFIHIDYETLNKDGFTVSGGERSEFNLLHEINDALKHDILLIDEPESSFDNIFLKSEVNELLKEISKTIPVIIVTHNSTVGASIRPNYIACTRKIVENGTVKYKIYFGHPSDTQLKCADGETIDNFEVMLNCLEAGEEAYNKRRTESYEILKN